MPPFTTLERELEDAFRKYHVRRQAARFVSGWIVAFAWGMHQGFTDWTTVLPIAGTAAWTVAAEMWPRLPLKMAMAALRGRQFEPPGSGAP